MTLRTLVRGSAIYAAGNLLARFGGFLLLPIYLQAMSREEYGLVALVTAIVGLLGIVCRVGLDGALMRFHFDVDGPRLSALYRTLMLATLGISAVILLLLGAAVGPFFDRIFFGVPFLPYGLLALAITFVGAADYVPAVLYRASQQPGRFFVFTFGSFALSSSLSVAFVLAGMDAVGVLLGQLLGGSIVLLAVVVIAMRPAGRTWDFSILMPALRFGAPLVPHQVSTWATRLSDRWLLGLLLALPTTERLAAIGSYSVGYQLGNLVAMISTSFNLAWTPYFYRVGERPEGPSIYREVLTLSAGGLAWLGLSISVMAEEVLAVIAPPEYGVAATVLPVVALASVCQGLYTMFVGAIFLRRRTAVLPLLTVSSAAASIGLNVLLIPRIGVMGAAWSTLAAYGLMAVLTFAVARTAYPVRIDLPRWALIVATAAAAYGASLLVPPPTEGLGMAILLKGGIILAAAALIFGVVRVPLRRLVRAAARSTDEAAEVDS